MTTLTWGQASYIGKIRAKNEDAVLSLQLRVDGEAATYISVFVVVDGIGGGDVGQQAAETAIRTIAKSLVDDSLADFSSKLDEQWLTQVVSNAIQAANLKIIETVSLGGGACVTVIAIVDDLVVIGHVGDTQAAQITAEIYVELTQVHDLVHRRAWLENLTIKEFWKKYQGYVIENMIYRALGQSPSVEVDTLSFRLNGDCYLALYSDGLTQRGSSSLSDDEIKNVILNSATPQQACDELVVQANARDGSDNISVIVVKISDGANVEEYI